jgi:hypothetical protein
MFPARQRPIRRRMELSVARVMSAVRGQGRRGGGRRRLPGFDAPLRNVIPSASEADLP